MPDIEIIKKHIAVLIQSLNNLQKHKGISISDLQNNLDLVWILERGFYLVIQNLFDIFAHIVAADFDLRWDSYSDVAEILFNKKLINEDDKNKLIQMAGYRNRLSHEYLSLELSILVDVVNNRLSDFSKFLNIVKEYCKL